MEKICRLCGRPKDSGEFDASKKNKDGRDSRCKQCRKDIYAANRDHCLQKVKEGYRKNREARLARKASFHRKNRDEILKRRRDAWAASSRAKDVRNKYWDERRKLCHEKLGGECCQCGQANSRVLCIDHVHGDGAQERKSGASLLKLWNKIIAEGPGDRYQLLCFNCNHKKGLRERPVAEIEGWEKTCPTCLEPKDASCFKSDKKYSDGKYYECRECDARRSAAVKQLAFLRLGSSRCLCGVDDPDMLTVDHVHGDGAGRRAADGLGISLYRKLVAGKLDRSRFQVMCLNCNILKACSATVNSATEDVTRERPATSCEPVREFDVKAVELTRKEFSEIVGLLDRHHYAGCGRASTVAYAGILGEEVIAVFKFSPPVRAEVARSMGMEPRETLELDRMCVLPDCHRKNLLSRLLSQAVKRIREEFPTVRRLVTFADPEFGHDGTVYKAANWTCVGKTSRSYTYLDADDKEHHKKTVYDAAKARGLKELEYASVLGLRRSHTVPKIKFVYDLR